VWFGNGLPGSESHVVWPSASVVVEWFVSGPANVQVTVSPCVIVSSAGENALLPTLT
jgi:hypothetical protein